jgi:predicted ATPase/class 3 adenylate cyclase
MADLPQGIVTFLFTDVEGSTKLWEEAPDSMMEALQQHDAVIDTAAVANNGVLVRPRGEGDSRFVVFPDALDAIAAGVDMQRGLEKAEWATPEPIVVRMALHTGASDLQEGDYYGSAVNRAARLRAVAHGGQILISRATCELVRDHLPEGVKIRDLGEHNLKDLTRPEHVFQIDIDGLADTFPPLTSLSTVPDNLPVQLTDFVGREDELDQAKRIIIDSRMLTILAPGGAGKTRLAIQAAADLATNYPDGAFFVDLAPVESSADIAQTTAESIGIALATDEDLQTQLLAHLANERLLLIFDNFEHVADGANIVSEILTAAPDVKVIATSRAKLNVTGETVLNLSGLDPHQDGVHLFLDAAMRADAGFTLESDARDPLERILRLVDGMPLGILLAAAWVDTLRVDEIANEIEKSLDFLETETGDTPDRHRSMRAVFDYSWSLLGEEERRIFAALSVFRGGFAREAADEIAGASLRSLANLVSKSLIVSDRDSGRYHVHELLRQYAEEELQRDRSHADDTMAAYIAFYAARTAEAEASIMAGQQLEAVAMVEGDLDNIRAAWRQTLANRDAAEARRFMLALWFVHEIRGWSKAGTELFGEAAEAFAEARGEPGETVRIAAAGMQAKFMVNLGYAEAAAPILAEAVERLRTASDITLLMLAIESQCELLIYLGQADEVIALSTEAMRVGADLVNEAWSIGMLNYQAMGLMMQGDLETATRILEEGDVVLAELGEQFMRPWNLSIRAMIAMMQGRVGDAIELQNLQVEIAREAGYPRAVAIALDGLGGSYAAAGDLDAAWDSLLEGLDLYEQMGLVVEVASVVVKIAGVQAGVGNEESAVEVLASVLSDPISSRQGPMDETVIADLATAALAEIQQRLESDVYAAAHARGSATPLPVMVKELLSET